MMQVKKSFNVIDEEKEEFDETDDMTQMLSHDNTLNYWKINPNIDTSTIKTPQTAKDK